MASFYDVMGVDPPRAAAPPPAAPTEPEQVESKGYGQTFSEGWTAAWQTLDLGTTAAFGATPEKLAKEARDTVQFTPSKEEEDYHSRVKERTDAFSNEPSWGGAVDVVTEVFSNLKVAGGDAIKGLVSSSPQIASGVAGFAVGGPIGGIVAYFGSGLPVAMLNDTAGELSERIAATGVNLRDEKAVTQALKDNPDLVEESLRAGAKGGAATWATESVMELATGVIGGKLLKPATNAFGKPLRDAAGNIIERGLGTKVAVGAGATVASATGEGLGAGAADLAKGKELQPGEYLAEGALSLLSEGPTSIIDVAVGKAALSPKDVVAEIFDKSKTVEQAATTAAGIIDRIITDTPKNRELQDTQLEVQKQVDAAMKEVEVETSTLLEKSSNAATRPAVPPTDVGQAVPPDVLQPAAGVRDPAVDPQPTGPGPGAGDNLNVVGPDSVQPVGNGGAAPADAAVGVQQPPGPDAVAAAPVAPTTAQPDPIAAQAQPATAQAPALPDAVAVKSMNMELAQKAAAEGTTAEAITLVDVATLPTNPTRIGGGRITLSQGEAKMLSDYAATFGKRVVIVRGLTADGVMGSNPSTVFVNAETKSAHHLVVTAHEVAHHLERDEPALFQQLVDALPSTLTDANLKKYAGSYKRTPEQITSMLADPVQRQALVGELIADLMGNNATRLKSHLEILAKAKGDPNLVVRIGQFILQFIDRLLKGRPMKEFSAAGSLAVADLKKARRVFTQVMAEYAVKQTGKEKLAAKVAEVQAKKASSVGAKPASTSSVTPVTPVTPATPATVATVAETAEKGPNQAKNEPKSTENEGSGTNANATADGADGADAKNPSRSVMDRQEDAERKRRTGIPAATLKKQRDSFVAEVQKHIDRASGLGYARLASALQAIHNRASASTDQLPAEFSPRKITDFRKKLPAKFAQAKLDAKPDSLVNKMAAREQAANPRMSEQRAPGFYSALETTLESAKMPKAPVSEWIRFLAGKQDKFRKEEVQWTGLKDFLALHETVTTGPVSKQTLLDFVKQNGVQLHEHMKAEEAAGRDPLDANDAVDVDEQVRAAVGEREIQVDALITSRIERQTRGIRDRAERREMAETLREELRNEPQYEIDEDEIRYAIMADIENSGRERATDELERDPEPTRFETRTVPGGVEYRELVMTLFGRTDANGRPQYQHKDHWENIKNPIAHVRFDTRIINGLKTLFIHELQSDWAQEIRDFKPGSDRTAPPDAPYTKETKLWTQMLVRRMITYAVQNGHEQVAFATGDQVNDFFTLDKQVDAVIWNEQAKTLKGYWRGDMRVELEGVTESKLKNHLGEDGAARMIAMEPPFDVSTNSRADVRRIEWEGKLGGYGMRHSYDVIVPSNVNTIIAPLGTKIEKVVAELPDRPWVYYTVPGRNGHKVARARSGPDGAEAYFVHHVDNLGNPEGVWGSTLAKVFKSERAANAEITRLKALPQPVSRSEQNAFVITPQMKVLVRGIGFPRMSEQRDESSDETINANSSTDAEALAETLGAKMYGEPEMMQAVTVKELYQNSFDAIKAVIERRPGYSGGKIAFKLNESERIVDIRDNGIGMLPEVFTKQFLHIASSKKEATKSSGGFGLAKLLFLYQNAGFHAATWRDGVLSIMDTSGPLVLASSKDGGAPIPVKVKRNVTRADLETLAPELHEHLNADDLSGTVAQVKIPAEYRETNTRLMKAIPFDTNKDKVNYSTWQPVFQSILHSPLFYPIDVTWQRDENDAPEFLDNAGRAFPMDQYTPFADVNFPWGSVKVYVGNEETSDTDDNVTVLSNGIYQFRRRVKLEPQKAYSNPLPRKFFLDVSPTVPAKAPDYPFTTDRQSFFKPVEEVIQNKLFHYLWLAHKKDEMAQGTENFGTVEFVDAGGNVTAGPVLQPQVVPTGLAQAPKARLDAGATVEVRDGEMFVSGQVLPQLDLMSLANARIDYDSFKLSQADFSADTPVIHDNVEVDTTPGDEFGPDVDENGVPAQGIRAPLIEVLRKEFGARRVNRMMYDITQPMQRIRETLRANGYQRIIDDNEGWALGISTDVKYRGVSTTIPFKFMAVNPFGYTWPDDPSSKEFAIQALSLFGTMVHEFAHMRERNHDEDGFIPEQAKLVAIMGAEDGRSISNSLRYALAKHVDILKRGEDLLSGNSGGNPKSRGRRLSDATPDSIPSRVPAEPDRAGAGAQAPGGISARAAGERGLTPTGFDPGTQSAIQASPPRGANQGVDDNGNEQGQQDGSTEARRGAGEGPGPQAGFRSNGPGRARRRGQEPDPGRPGGRAAPGAAAGPAERAGAGGQLPLDGRDEGTDGQGRSAEDATGGPDDLSGETGEAGFQAGVPGQVRFAAERDAAPGSTWSADPSETFTVFGRDTGISKDAITRKLQNRHVDMLRAQQGMRRAGRSISEQADVIQREQAFHGRVSDQFRVFHQTELANLLQGLKQTGVSQDELGTFLNMRGAEAYNDHINRINPDPEMWDQGSGTHTDVANAYLGNLSPAQRFKYDRLAAIVDRMTKGTREYLVAAGLETRETIEAWEAAFPNYTPRHRDEVVGSIGDGTGGGFVAHRPFSKAAMGSDKAVIDVVANVVTQRENAIVKAEKTRVARSAWELAVDNPNADFWKAIDPSMDPAERRAALLSMGMDESLIDLIGNKPFVKRKDKRTGMVVRVPNPLLANNPMVFPVRINGQDKILLFNERSERAQGVAAALRNLDPDKLGELLTLSGKFSRFFAAINTQWNVIFGVVNLVRDTGSAMANLSTTPIRGMQGAVLKNLPAALLGVYNATRDRRAGKIPTGAWAARYEEFQRLGGKTGFRDMYENSASRTADLDKELRAVKGEGLWNRLGGRALFAWIGDYNDAMENSVRLSAWHAAVSSGRMTPEAAAIMAKNLTVNFNKKGQWATQAGALYAFFNASAQGTARLYETVTGPKGKAIIGGGLAMGALQAMMLAAAGFKEGEPPEFIKQRNLVIPNAASDKGYFLIPLPLGLHVIPNITRMAFEYANSGFKDAPKRVTEFLGMVADAFNPIGNAGLSMQTVTPTVFDPIAALIENRDFANRPIAREDFNSLKPTPGFTRSKDTASWMGRYISEAMNTLTGGTKYTPGVFSPTPDQIDYLAGQLGGGVAREILKSQSVARAQITGEDVPWYKVPLVGRFYGENKGAPVESARFYENVKALNLLSAEVKGRQKDGISTTEFLRDNPEYQAYGQATAAQKEVSNLRKIKRGLIEKDAEPEKVRVIEERIVAAMARLNQRVQALQEKRQ